MDLVFICRKCEHTLFLSKALASNGAVIARKLMKMNCPDCGEDAEDLWIFSRIGSYKKEYGN